MIGGPDSPVNADGPRTEFSLEIPAGSELEIAIFRLEARDKENEHAGRWLFAKPGSGRALLSIDWPPDGTGEIAVSVAGEPPSSSRVNPESVLWPDMVLRIESGTGAREVELKVTDSDLLKGYYQQESHQDEYVVEHQFFRSFHEARLRVLSSIFARHIKPGSRVLDVGSGYSIFFLIPRDWEFDVTCCDLDSAAMEKMRALEPSFSWEVADALHLPYDDGSFDAVFAGEIVEHVGRPVDALAEWGRLLKPGGVLILSTPNLRRLLARANRKPMPVHPEHVSEMSLRQIKSAARDAGFVTRKATGIYFEFMINWWRPAGRRVDLLTARYNDPRYSPLYRLAMEMGRIAPSLAFDLILVCKKR